jgi:WD40 repeat protein
MSHTVIHPTDDMIEAFALGKFDPPGDRQLEEHLAGCELCQDRAEAIAPDTLVELLASARTRGDADRSAATTPTLAGSATPSLHAPTQAWDETAPRPVDDGSAPAVLTGHAKYRVLRRLGVGGMGTVWLAEHTVMNRQVAVKVIRPDLLARPGATGRFLREVRAAAKLHHPNIVTAFDAEPVGESCLLVMEYVPGETLADRVKAGPLPAVEACQAVRDAARGLAHAHAAGLVHRDVKPHNLIRTNDGTVKVLDFGLAGVGAGEGIAAAGDGLTGAGMVCGTPEYIAPEQITDPHTADARADIYGLGCTLYHLLAGHAPFPEGTIMDKLAAQQTREPDPISGLADDLAAVLAKMLAKRPEERYQTADEVIAALGTICDTNRPTPRASYDREVVRRSARFVMAVIALIAIVVVGGVIFKIQRDNLEIVIKTDDPDIEVVMKRNGELVQIKDTTSGETWELDTVKNQIGLADKPEGLKLDLPGKEPIILRRQGKEIFSVTRVPKPAAENVGELRRFQGHEGPVRGVAYSPDGRFVLSGSGWPDGDRTVRLWDVATGKEIRKFEGHSDQVFSVAFSPDGRRALSSGADKTMRLWDVDTGKELRRFNGPDFGVTFSPDGRRALSGSGKRILQLWDLETGKEIRKFEGHEGWVISVAFSHDGLRAASTGSDYTLRLWEVETGKELKRFHFHTGGSAVVTYSPNGRFLLSGGPDLTVRLWDVESGKELRSFVGHTGFVTSVAFSPDGRRALSGSRDKTLRLWDVETGKELHCFQGHIDGVWAVAFSPDGLHAVSGGGGTYPDGIVGPGTDWSVRLWRLPELPEEIRPLAEIRRDAITGANNVPAAIVQVTFSPDGRYFLAAGDARRSPLRIYDGKSGQLVSQFVPDEDMGWSGGAFNPDGTKVLSWSYGISALYVWESSTGQRLHKLEGHTEAVNNGAFSPDGKLIVTGSQDHTLRVWDVATGKQRLFLEGHKDDCGGCFSPDGKRIVSAGGGDDGTIRGWDAATGKEVWKLTEQAIVDFRLSSSSLFSPDGTRLLSLWGDTVRVWEVATGKAVATLAGSTAVIGANFLPDGQRVVSWGKDKMLRIWNLADGKEVRNLDLREDLKEGEGASVAISPDGRLLLTLHGRTVRLRELATGKELHSYAINAQEVRSLAFSPNSRFAAAGSSRSWVYLWRLPDLTPAQKP